MFRRKVQKINTADGVSRLKHTLASCDTVIIGAGAGLSTSAGFIYTGERFQKYFKDFADKYHFADMYSGGFYPYETLEEHWAYWSRYIYVNRYMNPPKPLYDRIFELVKDKDYFVLTTNVDHCFQKSGFDKNRMFYTQGDYGLFQCSQPCHDKTYDNEEIVKKMLETQGFTIESDENGNVLKINGNLKMEIPAELVPVCPKCGKPMSMNLRADNTFVEDEGWQEHAELYTRFLRNHQNTKTLFLELGVGYNTPGIIKYNFWKMTDEWKDATYACLNYCEAASPGEIEDKSICINEDIGSVIEKL
jgi:NAD-dependent SIR2 family protein deacetylase